MGCGDVIVDLPMLRGYNAIMVVINYFPKQATFVLAKPPLIALQVGKLFFKNVFKYHGMPSPIVSNRHPHFTSQIWQELFKLQDTKL